MAFRPKQLHGHQDLRGFKLIALSVTGLLTSEIIEAFCNQKVISLLRAISTLAFVFGSMLLPKEQPSEGIVTVKVRKMGRRRSANDTLLSVDQFWTKMELDPYKQPTHRPKFESTLDYDVPEGTVNVSNLKPIARPRTSLPLPSPRRFSASKTTDNFRKPIRRNPLFQCTYRRADM